MVGKKGTLEERFWNHVSIPDNRELCWEWNGSTVNGYGHLYIGKETSESTVYSKRGMMSHRISYELHNKIKLLKDQNILHKCNNRCCVNPSHLYIGTLSDNVKDNIRNNKHSLQKLSVDNVQQIRQLLKDGKLSHTIIASLFNVGRTTIGNINTGHSFSYIPCIDS